MGSITGPKVCNGKYQNVSEQLETYLGWANGQHEGKEKEISCSFTSKTSKYQLINKEPINKSIDKKHIGY
jgi:hypothetical protein